MPTALVHVNFFEDLFREMRKLCPLRATEPQLPFKNIVFSVDSATITPAASVFKWAAGRGSKNGVKIHTILDHDEHMPAFAAMNKGKTRDSKFLEVLELQKRSFAIVDRAYSAPKWFFQISQNELFL